MHTPRKKGDIFWVHTPGKKGENSGSKLEVLRVFCKRLSIALIYTTTKSKNIMEYYGSNLELLRVFPKRLLIPLQSTVGLCGDTLCTNLENKGEILAKKGEIL
jgi:hypothetical protein